MAKRKRLAPAKLDTEMPPLETKSMGRLTAHPAPPIAHVAGDASATAALEEMSETLRRARAEGRMILDIPLDQIDEGYLVRDRVESAGDEMAALQASLKARGQQTPIELVDLGDGRYGLISGWRRIQALRSLGAETARAIITPPRDATDAYVAMIEENEVRLGLSYFERARIVLKSVEAGVYTSHKTALQSLFSTASRAKRSKIKSFIPVVDALEGVLKFPAELGERLGLQLSKHILQDRSTVERAKAALKDADSATAEAEQAALKQSLKSGLGSKTKPPKPKDRAFEAVPGISLSFAPERNEITLQGDGVTLEMRSALKAWLRERYT